MRSLWKRFTSAFVIASCAACSLCPTSESPPALVDPGPLPIWAADTRIPGVERHGEKVKCSDERFNEYVCFTLDEWEAFYLRNVVGIDPDRENIDRE